MSGQGRHFDGGASGFPDDRNLDKMAARRRGGDRMRRVSWWRAMPICCALAAAIPLAAPANAQDVVIARDVTVREQPRRRSRALEFPSIGTRLDLLDGGRQVRGYYSVRLPDGRLGWVYRTFVRVVPEEGEPLVPPPPPPPGADQAILHFIDVDQGASALLEFPCGAVLVDAGVRGTAARANLLDYLERFFARRADLNRRLAAVFITHALSDHDNVLPDVAERFGVGGFVFNGFTDARIEEMLQRATGSPPVAVERVEADDFAAGPARGFTNPVIDPLACEGTDPVIRVLAGGRERDPRWSAEEHRNPNNHSLVVRVDFGKASLLVTGDLELPGIEEVLARHAGTRMLDVDVYAVGHHGADDATTAAFLQAMSPDVAVISAGRHDTVRVPRSAWDHGHPRLSVVHLLESAIRRRRSPPVDMMLFDRQEGQPRRRPIKDAIYSTSRDGDVRVIAGADGALIMETSR